MLAGDEHAFSEFFEGHFSRLYRFALPRLDRDADAAEEVAQVTLCKAIAGLRGYRGESALFTWMCTICRREIAAYRAARGRQAGPAGLIEGSAEVRAPLESLALASEGGPEGELHRLEVARLIPVTLDALPRAYGDALEWKYVDDLPVKEIAARLD